MELAERFDLFQSVRPYYGKSVMYDVREGVPTLHSLSMKCVLDFKVDFETIPVVLKNKLNLYKNYEEFTGPRVMKCSKCLKFYSKHKKFVQHSCC